MAQAEKSNAEYMRRWRAKHADRLKAIAMEHREKTPEQKAMTNAIAKRYRVKHAMEFQAYRAAYRQRNKDRINALAKAARIARGATEEEVKAYNAYRREYYASNRDRVLARRSELNLQVDPLRKSELVSRATRRSKLWKERHPEQAREIYRRRRRIRLETDENFHLRMVLSKRIRTAVTRQQTRKHGSTVDLLGCTVPELRRHLEKQFKPGMTWDNYGRDGWHIDHKIPCAEFDLRSEFQQLQCFHFSNLQPLWGKENISKGDKVLEPYQKTLPL